MLADKLGETSASKLHLLGFTLILLFCFCDIILNQSQNKSRRESQIRELTKRRRRRQRRRYKTIGLVIKNNGSARSACAFYILVHFFAVTS